MNEQNATRENLVRAGFELFHRQGYGATSVSQILKSAGCNSGSLYYFFPTKEDLLIAVLNWCLENLWPEVIEPVFERISDPIERVFGILDGYRKMLVITECQQGCPIGNLALELADNHPRVRELLAQNFSQWRQAVEGSLRMASDRFPESTDLESLSLFVLTTMEGAVMLARAYRSLDAYDSAVTQLRNYIERLLLEGSTWGK
ncbi:MAG: TetR/AcrR family transcriptional regulator [Planctomycetales bacterium]|nr:TetR/AcrR family transcriptional regulator [Planctomycetales bacterium]